MLCKSAKRENYRSFALQQETLSQKPAKLKNIFSTYQCWLWGHLGCSNRCSISREMSHSSPGVTAALRQELHRCGVSLCPLPLQRQQLCLNWALCCAQEINDCDITSKGFIYLFGLQTHSLTQYFCWDSSFSLGFRITATVLLCLITQPLTQEISQ